MNEYLARKADRPLWSPAYTTISDLFRQLSPLQVGDPLKLVCDLYRVYTEQTGIDDTLDHFFGWGQILLADFDDIDKKMADADKVFANLRDIHELDGIDYLTDEQKQIIKQFFGNFSDDQNSLIKERFLRLWSKLGDIYHAYNQLLERQGLAYEGALYRRVVTELVTPPDDRLYVFVGFNVLQDVEQQLFSFLMKEGKARFYWDFDRYYMEGNEAGHFIGQYLSYFPNELDTADDDIYHHFADKKHIAFVSATTENIQARYCRQWIEEGTRIADGRRTAVVLCNEALLPAVVHSLPEAVERVNITTGYPLSQAPIASFVRLLISLRMQGAVKSRSQYRLHFVKQVLRHPYALFVSDESAALIQRLIDQHNYYPTVQELCIDEGTTLLFGTIDGESPSSASQQPTVSENAVLLQWLCRLAQTIARHGDADDPLFQETLFRTYGLLNRLLSLVSSGDLTVDSITMQRLIVQLITNTSIPFHGEPAEGLQVMGVLETRNIDFDHVLLLSCGEGNMPKGLSDASFIPYNIRKAYGLTTIDHKVSTYSYYFHRLLQRASDITILYNHATSDGQTGEMSRFMLQMLVESPHHISQMTLQAGQQLQSSAASPVEKSAEVLQRLLQRFAADRQPAGYDGRPLLTPTCINRYQRCQLQFYYRYVCGLREPDESDDDTIDNRIFGNIFHEASRIVYSQLTQSGPRITASQIDSLLRTGGFLERAVDEAFRKELFQSGSHIQLSGLQIISREVIVHYLRLLLRQDQKMAPFTILGLECDVTEPVTISCGDTTFTSRIGGRIDRLDSVVETAPDGKTGERIRVVDYKTGNRIPAPLGSLPDVFSQDSLARHSDYYLQTLLYACQVRRSAAYNARQLPVSPALLFIQHASTDPVLTFGKNRIDDVALYEQEFGTLLSQVVHEMFDPQQPFSPTADRSRCLNCPYKALCAV